MKKRDRRWLIASFLAPFPDRLSRTTQHQPQGYPTILFNHPSEERGNGHNNMWIPTIEQSRESLLYPVVGRNVTTNTAKPALATVRNKLSFPTALANIEMIPEHVCSTRQYFQDILNNNPSKLRMFLPVAFPLIEQYSSYLARFVLRHIIGMPTLWHLYSRGIFIRGNFPLLSHPKDASSVIVQKTSFVS